LDFVDGHSRRYGFGVGFFFAKLAKTAPACKIQEILHIKNLLMEKRSSCAVA